LSYIELHARSAFSFLEGACVPEELASLCAGYQMPAMALLDRHGVYGSPRFHLAAQKLSLRPHIGAEVTSPQGWRYALLVESRAGYQNLCRLITQTKLRGMPPCHSEPFAVILSVAKNLALLPSSIKRAGMLFRKKWRRRPRAWFA